MNRKAIVALAMASALAGCGGGSSSSGGGGGAAPPSPPPASSPSVGVLGVVEDRSAGLVGIDANANGLRDDVDALIGLDYSTTPEVTRAAQQTARAVQALLTATSRESARTAGSAMQRAAYCTRMGLPEAQSRAVRRAMSGRLEALTINTRERLRAYLTAADLLIGQTLTAGTEPYCD